jgi:hypothetical protein
MTATSTQSATETPSTADSPREMIASLRTVVVPASPATYANRTALRAIGLRWDPAGRRWHGTTTADRVRELREQLGLEVRVFGTLEPPRGPKPPKPSLLRLVPGVVRDLDPARRLHDGSRTCAEARVAYRDGDDDAEEIVTLTRTFSVYETTSGLPDDSREEDERVAARSLRERRARVRAAREVVATTPGLAETLQRDRRKAAPFFYRFGITEDWLRRGVPSSSIDASQDPALP